MKPILYKSKECRRVAVRLISSTQISPAGWKLALPSDANNRISWLIPCFFFLPNFPLSVMESKIN